MARVLVINTGSSSTKVALFEDEREVWKETVRHDYETIRNLRDIKEHLRFREEVVREILKKRNVTGEKIDAIAVIGGLLKPLKSGTYEVNEKMVFDLYESKRGFHASNLSGIIGYNLAREWGIKAYTVDQAVAKRWAKENNRAYDKSNLVVIHLGSGITVSAHRGGRMVDLTNSMEEGPFSVERTGTLPVMSLARLCFSGRYTFDQVKRMIFGEGGMYAYLREKDFRKVMDRVKAGDPRAKEVVEAMLYQVGKEAGGMAAVLEGKVDAVLITGGMAYEDYVVDTLRRRISFIAPVYVYPGEDEMRALTEGVLRVLRGEEDALTYG